MEPRDEVNRAIVGRIFNPLGGQFGGAVGYETDNKMVLLSRNVDWLCISALVAAFYVSLIDTQIGRFQVVFD